VAIGLKDVNDPEKKLVVYTCPSGNFTFHVGQCQMVGLEYAGKLSARNLPPRDAWMGTRYQLYPKLIYGAVAITHLPKKLVETFQSIWYKLLSLLNVNLHITKEFCMLATMFQGLTLPNPNIDVLSRKVHLIQHEWGTNGVLGKLLHHAYQIFQVKVGLHGNIFDYSFDNYGDLATHGFFQNMWQLPRMFGVKFRIHDTFDIPLLCKDNHTIMDLVADTGIFSKSELVRLNRFQHHKKVYSIEDLTQCNGLKVDPVMFLREEGESMQDFSNQRPTAADHRLWLRAIGSLTVGGHKLRHPLGEYISDPHLPDIWVTSESQSEIYQHLNTGGYEVFQREVAGRQTRYGTRYHLKETQEGECERLVQVSVRDWDGQSLQFHSAATTLAGSDHLREPTSLKEVLQSWEITPCSHLYKPTERMRNGYSVA
jgi:hypothetical protein